MNFENIICEENSYLENESNSKVKSKMNTFLRKMKT